MEAEYTFKLTLYEKLTIEGAVINQMIEIHDSLKESDSLRDYKTSKLEALKRVYELINGSTADSYLKMYEELKEADEKEREERSF